MRGAWFGVLSLGSMLVACGGLVVFERSGGPDDDDGGVGGSGTWGVVSSGDYTSVGQGTGGDFNLVAAISEVKLGANCMPVVGPDPLGGVVVVRYDNYGNVPGELQIESASVLFVNANEGWLFGFELSPDSSGLIGPGASQLVEHTKVESPGNSAFLCQLCGQKGEVELVFADAQGRVQRVAESFELGCAY